MDALGQVNLGMKAERAIRVEASDTAGVVGSGALEVLATPRLIAYVEHLAADLLAEHLPEGYSSVGVWVELKHLAATPPGMLVRVACEIVAIDGRRATFTTEAWDEVEKVAEGQHQRVVIEVARFLQRLQSKQAR